MPECVDVPVGVSLLVWSGADEVGRVSDDEDDELVFFPSTLSCCFSAACLGVSFDPGSKMRLLRFEMPFNVLSLDLGLASAPIGCSLLLTCS